VDVSPDRCRTTAIGSCLKPGVTVEQARADLDANLASIKGNMVAMLVCVAPPNQSYERVRRGLSLLMAAVAGVADRLWQPGESTSQRRSYAPEGDRGAAPWVPAGGQIVRQLFRESLGLSMLGGAAGVICADWIVSGVLTQLLGICRVGPQSPSISARWRLRSSNFSLALLFAALPRLAFSKADPQEALRQSQREPRTRKVPSALRQWLTAAQGFWRSAPCCSSALDCWSEFCDS